MKKSTLNLLTISLTIGVFLFACRTEEPDPPNPICEPSYNPVVLVHGFLGSGDTWAPQVQRFEINDYCQDRLYAFDWNSLDQDRSKAVDALNNFIDQVLSETGASQVDLAGHSAGGSLGYDFLSDTSRAKKVAHYAHVGSGVQSGPAGAPTINIYTRADSVVSSGDIPGATNVALDGLDHYQVATDAQTFEAMYRFFRDGRDPGTTEIRPATSPTVEVQGRLLGLGDNQPKVGSTLEVYEVNPGSGVRTEVDPSFTQTIEASGNWGPVSLKTDVTYEFVVNPGGGERVLHYYREGFKRSNKLVYFRTLPPPGSQVGILLSGIPKDPNQTAVAIFSASQAVIAGRDNLEVDNFDLAIDQYASAGKTTIAYFLYDDGNYQTTGNIHLPFQLFPVFLTGLDYFIPTANPEVVALTFNGRTLNVPNLPSNQGIVIGVFD